MKITYINGALTAEAETLRDVEILVALREKQRQFLAAKPVPPPVVKRVPLKSKKQCVLCGKRVKHLSAHIKYNHKPIMSNVG